MPAAQNLQYALGLAASCWYLPAGQFSHEDFEFTNCFPLRRAQPHVLGLASWNFQAAHFAGLGVARRRSAGNAIPQDADAFAFSSWYRPSVRGAERRCLYKFGASRTEGTGHSWASRLVLVFASGAFSHEDFEFTNCFPAAQKLQGT